MRNASPALAPGTLDQSVMVADTPRSASLTAGSGTRSSMSIALRSNAMRFTSIDQPGTPGTDAVFPVSFTIRASSSVPSRSRTARNLTSRPCISPSVTLRAPRSTSMPPTASAGIRHSGLRLPGSASVRSLTDATPCDIVKRPSAPSAKCAARSSEPFCTSTASASR